VRQFPSYINLITDLQCRWSRDDHVTPAGNNTIERERALPCPPPRVVVGCWSTTPQRPSLRDRRRYLRRGDFAKDPARPVPPCLTSSFRFITLQHTSFHSISSDFVSFHSASSPLSLGDHVCGTAAARSLICMLIMHSEYITICVPRLTANRSHIVCGQLPPSFTDACTMRGEVSCARVNDI